ncbi:MAG: radical SAM protein [Candidatus Omnitrophota bacterium]|nr:radical SAM protein [Candidatus Omnitrophota bacterium]
MEKSVYIIQGAPSWLKTPPLSLVYLKNYLKSKCCRVKIRDLNIEFFKLSNLSTKEWLALNQDFEKNLFKALEKKFNYLLEKLYREIENYELIGLSISKRNAPFSLALAEEIRKKYPHKKIVFGGPQTLFLGWQDKLDHNYHWVIGEGEIPLYKILNGDKSMVHRFDEIENLDKLPFLNFEPLNLKLYSQYIPLFSSRGCMHNCKFCSEKKLYKKFKYHSPQYMIEQIKFLMKKYKTNSLVFCDSLINYNNEWLEKFCSLTITNNLNIKWEAQMRIDPNFTVELGMRMKTSGCYNLFVGLESASDEVLQSMQKGFTQEIALGFFEKLNKAGLQFEISLIFGYPGETEVDFKKTLNFITKNKKIIPKIAQANPFVDYMNGFSNETFPTKIAMERTNFFLKNIEREKIKYTKSFINNLIY